MYLITLPTSFKSCIGILRILIHEIFYAGLILCNDSYSYGRSTPQFNTDLLVSDFQRSVWSVSSISVAVLALSYYLSFKYVILEFI